MAVLVTIVVVLIIGNCCRRTSSIVAVKTQLYFIYTSSLRTCYLDNSVVACVPNLYLYFRITVVRMLSISTNSFPINYVTVYYQYNQITEHVEHL